MRKLVTIRRMEKIYPIPKADRLELGTVGGWSVIIKKGEIKEDDLFVFFEIDSFLPADPLYDFLGRTTTHQGQEGYRIRTMKMRGAISQGLALPMDMFYKYKEEIQFIEGEDITDIVNVIKYDIDLVRGGPKTPGSNPGRPKGSFPSFIPKTDQERIQNLGHYFTQHEDTEFEETIKLDGSSMTCYKAVLATGFQQLLIKLTFGLYIPKPHFGVCSRNLELKRPTDTDKQSNFWNTALIANLENDLPVGFAVQGEVIAPNIQSNYEKVTKAEFYIFNVYSISASSYLLPDAARKWVAKYLPKATYIPVIEPKIAILKEYPSFDSMQTRVSGPSLNPGVKAEGRVYKAVDGSCSFKCISNEYLLQKDK